MWEFSDEGRAEKDEGDVDDEGRGDEYEYGFDKGLVSSGSNEHYDTESFRGLTERTAMERNTSLRLSCCPFVAPATISTNPPFLLLSSRSLSSCSLVFPPSFLKLLSFEDHHVCTTRRAADEERSDSSGEVIRGCRRKGSESREA